MENFDIFSLDNEDFLKPEPQATGGDANIYKPYPELGKDGVYKSLIRFLPNVANPKKSKIHKYYVWLKDPVDNSNFVADCPSTVGKKSILKDIFWKLKNSPSAKDQELAKSFARKEDYYSLIQVVKDPNKPELEGKIMVFKFGKKVADMIEQQIKPEYGTPCNPFDLFEGKNFGVHVRKVGDWNNYDLCQFVGEKEGIRIEGKQVEKTEADQKIIVEYLKAGPQDLVDKYDYKEWTDDDRDKITSIIRNIVPDGRMVAEILSGSPDSKSTYQAPPSSNNNPLKKETKESEFDDFLGDSSGTGDTNTPEPASPKKTTTSSAGSLDDLYNDL
jgi:hypothetical protein